MIKINVLLEFQNYDAKILGVSIILSNPFILRYEIDHQIPTRSNIDKQEKKKNMSSWIFCCPSWPQRQNSKKAKR